MRIGVDLCDLDPDYAGGIASFAYGLVHGLTAGRGAGDRIVLFATARNEAFLRRRYAGQDVEVLALSTGLRRLHVFITAMAWVTGCFKLRYWYELVFRRHTMARIDSAVDAMVAPLTVLNVYAMRAPVVLSLHDIQPEYHPELFTWRERVRRWAPYRLSAWRADVVQASSHYIKDCLLEKFRFLAPAKIVVIPEGVDRQRFSPDAPMEMPPALAGQSPFVFYPAQIWLHKNHLMLMEALALHRDRTGSEITCVLTGKDYGHWPVVAERIAALGLRQVHYLGLVSLAQLMWLYGHCGAVLALGMHESSSLPVREGAAFGRPLVALDIAPNQEAASELNLRIVRGVPDLTDALDTIAQGGEAVAAQGADNARRVARFDWTAIAAEYRAQLQRLCAKGR